MYHNIAETSGFNTVSHNNFEKQLTFIKETFKVISFEQYILNLQTERDLTDCLTITFDDGYRSFSRYAIPLLEKYTLPVILFIPVNHVGLYNSWDRDKTAIRLEILSWTELNEISNNPLVTVGSHGLTHRPLCRLLPGEITSEIKDSKKKLDEQCGHEIRYFSFPYGQIIDYNRSVIRELKRHNFAAACSTRYGRYNKKSDLFQLKRIEVKPEDTIEDFKRKCLSGFQLEIIKRYVKETLYRLKLYK